MTGTMVRKHPALARFDPLTDSRLDPPVAEQLFAAPVIPLTLHSAVRRARRLLGDCDGAELNRLVTVADQLAADPAAHMKASDDLTAQSHDFEIMDDADCLQAALALYPDRYPHATWPHLFAALAMRNAGYVLNEVGIPESKRESIIGIGATAAHSAGAAPHIEDLAAKALRAVSVAQGAAAGVREESRRLTNRKNAKSVRAKSRELADTYIGWVLDQSPLLFTSHKHAFLTFVDNLEQREDPLLRHVTSHTVDYTRKKLQAHCKQNGLKYPFPTRA